jgi:hypothetical protein
MGPPFDGLHSGKHLKIGVDGNCLTGDGPSTRRAQEDDLVGKLLGRHVFLQRRIREGGLLHFLKRNFLLLRLG